MIFPKYIKKGDTIGVTATSSGIVNELKQKRIKNAIKNFEDRGYNVKVTDNVYTADWRGCSSTGKERGEQFNELISNKDVSCIFSVAGGD